MRLPYILTNSLLALGLFVGYSFASVNAEDMSSNQDPGVVCVTELPGCEGEVATIRIVQKGEETIITVELCGESYTTSVDSSSSDPVTGTLTCCGPTGDKVTPTGTLTSSASNWGEVDDCEDFDIS
ncbi:MAG: hypothetical protein HQ519_15485 [Planctomycetes bacterium]|nr:hypothetical protein [Planctomycetota bacterium]